MLNRRDTEASEGREGTEQDEELEQELITRPSTTALNLTGASIRDSSYPGEPAPRGAPSIVLPHQEASYVRHIALDIGGSLIKLVYFSPDAADSAEAAGLAGSSAGGQRPGHGHHHKGGRMHFVKFETARIDDCLDFIQAKGLHRCTLRDGSSREVRVKATGGGAVRFADVFRQRLGLVLEREDEIGCAVGGCNFLLRTITHEAFAFEAGQAQFVPCSSVDAELFPYLLVNIGSGVSIIRVDGPGEGQHTRVSGSSVGGGTFWGLCRLLTGRRDFDEMLELSMQGNNANVDMLVGDIYGGRDYSSIGLSASTIASSFGKVVGQEQELADYNPADVAMSLCRMVAYNIGQLAYMHAKRYDLKRVFFGGFFIRGHPYTMETISFAIKFWSQGEMSALFLRHEGFLGAVGAFLKVHPMHVPTASSVAAGHARAAAANAADGEGAVSRQNSRVLHESASTKVRARFVERFSMGAPFAGGEVRGPAIRDMSDRVSWVEKFVAVGCQAQQQAQQRAAASAASQQQQWHPRLSSTGADGSTTSSSSAGGAPPHPQQLPAATKKPSLDRSLSMPVEGQLQQPASPTGLRTRIPLHVGVLHYSPTQEPFPLLADPANYCPNTIDINTDEAEYRWLLQVLEDQVPTVVEKAVKSEGGGDGPRRRAAAFGRAFTAHLQKLRQDPGAYGQLGLSDLFEMREECLREFGFSDVYRLDKEGENDVALQVLPDLLTELDGMEQRQRLLALVQGILAANIFDWGAKACVELYTNGTILDIYREARRRLSKRPWRVDDFDDFLERVYGSSSSSSQQQQQQQQQLPDAPAVAPASAGSPRGAQQPDSSSSTTTAPQQQQEGQQPPFRRVMVFVDNAGADIVLGMLPFVREMLRLGCEVVVVANSLPAINDITAAELRSLLSAAAEVCPIIKAARAAALAHEQAPGTSSSRGGAAAAAGCLAGGPSIPPYPGLRQRHELQQTLSNSSSSSSAGSSLDGSPREVSPAAAAAAAADEVFEPRLFVLGNGSGSPCLDLSRVPAALADATVGVDLLVIEGMGRAIHTNLRTPFKCDTLKLAMIKTERLAAKLFGGCLYDCMCSFQRAPAAAAAVAARGAAGAAGGGCGQAAVAFSAQQ
ncbi:hypothetical protein OEZ86_010083 [Tetradesmus obliquus]|uniref:Damage-control phosphatase ARMT1-like metal-binding domain-containing protein n=1 Tax=Tetradesmus obliquus TaxID=3088 RepID=A0ABY8UUH4_TETOB|nr:hypothetical protein OEZ85_001518 [Tetradesmus obliquus]WIA43643.1 hypothetical protein OEZ86_010083 [Tetradesmus obliquus]